MVRSAPRYDPEIDRLVSELEDPTQTMAEICRRVAAAAEARGLTRPSLVHLRTLVRDERHRREYERRRGEELRELAVDTAVRVAAGRVPHPYRLLDQIEDAGLERT